MRSTILSFVVSTLVGFATAGLLLNIDVLATGDCKRQSKVGDIISVNYNLTFTNGTFIESSKLFIIGVLLYIPLTIGRL